jgi:hypothetical protein
MRIGMSARPGWSPPDWTAAELERFTAEMGARELHDTVADDAAEGFLSEIDEALWIFTEVQEAEENSFPHAARKADHIEDLRRLLYRLHLVLVEWEEAAATR